MVCETPRLRSLLVSRRGGFLEDPFFRDAWGDYNHAVRRIVDRFNHGGMFAPRDRLQDSHYHSMYLTLRSARINLSVQSARIKDEGSVYKLVMDVREFLGGDITVRTAGGTLSVRGRLESGAGGNNNTNNNDDDASSRASSSSARTLHRRFNLPPDADGEKVASVLSRDAVLTVTIPKRTDVRVIPVKVEGEEQPGGGAATGAADVGGRSGTKRHSATQPDPSGPTPSKRTQDFLRHGAGMGTEADRSRDSERFSRRERDEAERSRGRDGYRSRDRGEAERGRFGDRSRDRGEAERGRFGERSRDRVEADRERFGESSRDREAERGRFTDRSRDREMGRAKDTAGRRGSDIFLAGSSGGRDVDPEVRRRSYPDSDSSRHHQADNANRRRSREVVEEEPAETFGQRSRRRTSKYEDAKEIRIPICIESDTNTTQPVTTKPAEVKDARSREEPQEPTSISQFLQSRSKPEDDKVKTQNSTPPPARNFYLSNAHEKENIKPPGDEPSWTYSGVYQNRGDDMSQTEGLGRGTMGIRRPADVSGKPGILSGKVSGGRKQPESEVKIVTPDGRLVTGAAGTPLSEPATTGMRPRVAAEPEGLTNGETAHGSNPPVAAACDRKPRHPEQGDSKPKQYYSRPEPDRNRPEPERSRPEPDRSRPRQDGARGHKDHNLPEQNDRRPQQQSSNRTPPGLDRTPVQTRPQQTIDSTLGQDGAKKDYLTKPSQNSNSPEGRSTSPFGGIEVKVEKRQSDMEGDMFKDCWQNFSSTLQDVLSRLQELSAELSQAKPLNTVTLDSTKDQQNSSQNSSRTSPKHPASQTPSSPRVPSSSWPKEEFNEAQTPESIEGSAGAAGARGSSGAARGSGARAEEGEGSTCPWNTQVGNPGPRVDSSGVGGARSGGSARPSTDSDRSQAVRRLPGTRAAEGGSDAPSPHPHKPASGGVGVVASPAGSPHPRPRPTSLDVARGGSLLDGLRKRSPVDALKDRFLNQTPSSGSSGHSDVHYIPVAVEAIKTVPAAPTPRPAPTSAPATSTAVPLCERRGRGVQSLVLPEDDVSSTTSDHSTASSDGQQSEASSSLGSSSSSSSRASVTSHSESGASSDSSARADAGSRHHKATAGNCGVVSGRDPVQQQQHFSSPSPTPHPGGHLNGRPATSQPRPAPDSDPAVDAIISQAEKVLAETRRLSSTNAPSVNDLGQGTPAPQPRPAHLAPHTPFNLAPNIDTRASPDSNSVGHQDEDESEDEDEDEDEEEDEDEDEEEDDEEEEEEGVVEGCLSIPLPGSASRPRPPRVSSPPEPTPTPTPSHKDAGARHGRSDSVVIESVSEGGEAGGGVARPTTVTSPEIQSGDVMGCARESGHGAPPAPRAPPHQPQLVRTSRHPAARDTMGGIFSRGRADDTRHTSPTAHTVASRAKAASPTPPTPTRPTRPRERSATPVEEPPLPPYVRQKSDSNRRHSGFSHVQSDNVRKIREAWSAKQETSPQQPRRGSRAAAPSPPPSPSLHRTPDSPRRAPDSPRRNSFTRTTPAHEPWARSRSPPRTNYASPTAASRSRSAASPRRGSSDDSAFRDSGRISPAAAKSSRPQPDNYSPGGRPGRRPSPARRTSPARNSRRKSPPISPRRTSPPSSARTPPTASPFHHKVFRRLRDSSLQPDSETICFKEEPDRYKLVMDVEEYVSGEIEVLQDDKSLTVKGRVKSNPGGSDTITRTFSRNFHIPNNTKEEDIDSALSKDGILTVYVPKKKERVIKIEMTD